MYRKQHNERLSIALSARKDDAPASTQAANIILTELAPSSGGGGLIQTTSQG
jgi:hypothetical protein